MNGLPEAMSELATPLAALDWVLLAVVAASLVLGAWRGLVAWLAKKLIEAVGLRPVDRVLGAVFGVVRAGVLVLVLGVVAQLTPVGEAAWWTGSHSGARIAEVVKDLRPALPEKLGAMLPV